MSGRGHDEAPAADTGPSEAPFATQTVQAALSPLMRALAFATRNNFAAADRVSGLHRLATLGFRTLGLGAASARRAGDTAAQGGASLEDDRQQLVTRIDAAFRALEDCEGPARVEALIKVCGLLAQLVSLPKELAQLLEPSGDSRQHSSWDLPPVPRSSSAPKGRPSASKRPTGASKARQASPRSRPRPEPGARSGKPQLPLQASKTRLEAPVSVLPGLGPRRAERMAERGLNTLRDLIYFLPTRYLASLGPTPISALKAGARATVVGEVIRSGVRFYQRRGRGFDAILDDGSGQLRARYYRGSGWAQKRLQPGMRVGLSGELREVGRQLEMTHPEILDPEDALASPAEGILPRYTELPGIPPRTLRAAIGIALEALPELKDPLPEDLCRARQLMPLREALMALHQPRDAEALEALSGGQSRAHARLIYEEFLILQLGLALKARGLKQEPGLALTLSEDDLRWARALAPFELTGAQTRVLSEIVADQRAGTPMNRLLQGDVGSGKTIVAGIALALTVRCGAQGALMAPTELLAEQHARSLQALLGPAGIRLRLVTGQQSAETRREVVQAVASGEAQVVVGTHALIQTGVRFSRLGLVVVDEQHRFGVAQRAALMDKGTRPDTLVMTATPIPRTLAMSAYGDLDLSVIDELPPGRSPVQTKLYGARDSARVFEQIREEVSAGRQAYLVYPLIEESEALEDVQAATERFEVLGREVFPALRLGLLHGRMKPAQKQEVMGRFVGGEIDLLVATTVIEVGIDVPNASLMVIEHAERFGLSSLHQLRGRVGRGSDQARCLLVAHGKKGEKARERLAVMVASSDGFVIAEEDLRIRGPGDLLGTRQHGHPELLFGNLVRDRLLLSQAREDAFALVARDPSLALPEHLELGRAMEARWKGRISIGRVG